MTAMLNFVGIGNKTEIVFHIGDDPVKKYPGIKHDNVVSIQLHGPELVYAIENLGAANVKQELATYFGDEAKRIYFNW